MDEPTRTNNANSPTLNPASWVDEHGNYLYRYALSRLRDTEAAEEAVQETFFAALGHIHQYAGKGSERGWLLGILKRKIIDLMRARSRTTSLSEDEMSDTSKPMFDRDGNWQQEAHAAGYQPLDSLEREEFWRILHECLKTLPPRQADAFVLREMDDQSTEQICKGLEVTPSNLWVMLYRARLQLSSCMKTRWNHEIS